MLRLGVNIDHVATLRQARGGREPDPIQAAVLAELGGADSLTIHLREDRRHISDRDLRILRETAGVPLNLELALDTSIIALAIKYKPDQLTFVPERREELTTEGGLDVVGQLDRVREAVARCRDAGLSHISMFIDPNPAQVEASAAVGAVAIELHTGKFAEARGADAVADELKAIQLAGKATIAAGLHLHAGHGLNYQNVGAIATIAHMEELNIGHSIISRAVLVGLDRAVREMKALIRESIREPYL